MFGKNVFAIIVDGYVIYKKRKFALRKKLFVRNKERLFQNNTMQYRRPQSYSLCIICSLFLLSMSMPLAAQEPNNTNSQPVLESALHEYKLGNGDSIIIKIWSGEHFEQGMSGEYILLSNGSIELPIVGAVQIGGQNERDASETLSNALGEYIINPVVHINIKSYNSQKVHVLGAVERPGPIVLDRSITLLSALSKASLSRTKRHDGAWAAQKVYVQHADGYVDVIPLDPLLQNGEGNCTLKPDDIIYVADGAYVYVNGKVEKPGGVPYRNGMTVTDALSHAGGSSVNANLKEVYILRDGKRIHVNVKQIFQGKTPDIDLKEGDRLFIEESIW